MVVALGPGKFYSSSLHGRVSTPTSSLTMSGSTNHTPSWIHSSPGPKRLTGPWEASISSTTASKAASRATSRGSALSATRPLTNRRSIRIPSRLHPIVPKMIARAAG
ncbi:hypothetical protein CASFOL_041178 [Castilleja foliolosa]|uniref:Uncharacterized protein n=1 Tax=Castilleja foliolosa TaxID=1961234 RepID=A0ABD3BE04_9LAMI